MDNDETLDELRPRLVAAMPPHVAFDGWTSASVAAAAASAGIDPDIAGLLFPGGSADMVDAYTALANTRMIAAMAGAGNMKIRQRVTLAIRTRLEQAEGEREAVSRALAIFALPQNLPLSARTLWRTADAMWRAAGDTATDLNYYSKRAILGGIYAATLLYWLGDESDGRTETWAFLDRRIDGIMRFEMAKARLAGTVADRPSLARLLGRLRYPAV
ncbi:MAG: COQ9 family protein [Janthinobacterium lividum]